MDPVELDEWRVVLIVRQRTTEPAPHKWDFTELLDLNTGQDEEAWVESATIEATGTAEALGE